MRTRRQKGTRYAEGACPDQILSLKETNGLVDVHVPFAHSLSCSSVVRVENHCISVTTHFARPSQF